MCSKTKTSYGCGHCVKVTDPCDLPDCTQVDKWKFPAHKDCPQCRAGGEAVTRGREGRGRHGREMRTPERRQSSSDSYTTPPASPSVAGTPNLSISPWAMSDRSKPKEKKWDTPTRRKADEAWLAEHDRRISDLEDATCKMSLRSHRDMSRDSRRQSPRSSYEHVIEADEVEEPEEIEPFPRSQPRAIKMSPYEVSHESDHSRSHRRSRKASQASERSHTRGNELVHISTTRRKTHYDAPISEYPNEPSPQQFLRKSRHTKTEPYHPSYPQSCAFDPPTTVMQGNSPIVGGHWTNHYEMVHPQRPLQHDAYYTRQDWVY